MMRKRIFFTAVILVISIVKTIGQPTVLKASSFKHYVDSFNLYDEELPGGMISNQKSWAFLSRNIPFFECPDKALEKTYYFRWWTYRKHIKQTPEGFVITEFLPDVPWTGKYNAISCAAALHFYEGRWLHGQKYLNGYADYWFHDGGSPRAYSFWPADALYNFYLTTNNKNLVTGLLPELIKNYEGWEHEHCDSSGLFWQIDDRDGMEVSICGEGSNGIGYRATINAYMYGEVTAIARIARLLQNETIALRFEEKARLIKTKIQDKLWDKTASFFKVLPRSATAVLCTARELHGYTPWYFNLPDRQYSIAWKFLMDTTCFFAPYGPTTADQSHPGFNISYNGHECQWNGPSWPYATSITLTGLANLLNNYDQHIIGNKDYYKLLSIYADSQQRIREDGKTVPWIDENLDPFTGDWISRSRLKVWSNGTWSAEKGGAERGKDYNHSTFCDLIITGLIGLRPRAGDTLIINPLVPENTWDYFCLDNVLYHGKIIAVVYDKTGNRYKKGKGLMVFVNGKRAAFSNKIERIKVTLSK